MAFLVIRVWEPGLKTHLALRPRRGIIPALHHFNTTGATIDLLNFAGSKWRSSVRTTWRITSCRTASTRCRSLGRAASTGASRRTRRDARSLASPARRTTRVISQCCCSWPTASRRRSESTRAGQQGWVNKDGSTRAGQQGWVNKGGSTRGGSTRGGGLGWADVSATSPYSQEFTTRMLGELQFSLLTMLGELQFSLLTMLGELQFYLLTMSLNMGLEKNCKLVRTGILAHRL